MLALLGVARPDRRQREDAATDVVGQLGEDRPGVEHDLDPGQALEPGQQAVDGRLDEAVSADADDVCGLRPGGGQARGGDVALGAERRRCALAEARRDDADAGVEVGTGGLETRRLGVKVARMSRRSAVPTEPAWTASSRPGGGEGWSRLPGIPLAVVP